MNGVRPQPSKFQKYNISPELPDGLSFLVYEDWFLKEEHLSKDWVIVARSWEEIDTKVSTSYYTFSALASYSKTNVKTILSSPNWDVNKNLGTPYFSGFSTDKKVHYDPGVLKKVGRIIFRPFTLWRTFHNFIPPIFEVLQNFILYHEAFHVANQNEYHRIDDTGNIIPLIRLKQYNDGQIIEVDAHHLKDYLAANKCSLIRYHDHYRWSTRNIDGKIQDKFSSHLISDDLSNFELWLRTNIPREAYISHARLVGKDLILPYKEPDRRHTSFILGKENEKYESFIIGRDKDGKLQESICDENKLSNYFVNRGTPHFLTPVFFQLQVLDKYYAEPRRYDVGSSSVGCLDLWGLPIDITGENLVQVWLGDLGRIPYSEQLHWKSFNIEPRGKITKHRFTRDFLGQPADPTDVIYHFYRAFDGLQNLSKQKFNKDFFKRLKLGDKHLYKLLHVPHTEEWKEFDEQIQILSKITTDSLNVTLLSIISGKKIGDKNVKGSIDLLFEVISSFGLEDDIVQEIIHPFQILQALRSSGVAHRKGKKFEKNLKRFDLYYLSNPKKFEKIIVKLSSSLNSISQAIQ